MGQTSFYQTPGTYTNPREFRELFQSLPDADKEIVKFIKMVLIHPVQARASRVRFNYAKTLRSGVIFVGRAPITSKWVNAWNRSPR